MLPLSILGFVGMVLSDVSVDVGGECNPEEHECSEDVALLQRGSGWPKWDGKWNSKGGGNTKGGKWPPAGKGGKGAPAGKCHAIKHDCGETKVPGFIFTALNGEGENKVVVFDKNADGSLGRQRVYGTGSNGGSNTSRGGALRGDYDAQFGMVMIGPYLLVVNGGGNTVTSFLTCTDGSLEHLGNVPSGGERPVSITFVPKGREQGKYWVVVGNQWANPLILGTGENTEYYPNAAYHLDHLYEKNNLELNIFLFSFCEKTGKLTPERKIESYPGTWGGPAAVGFNADGTKLGLTTWGIAHDATPEQIQKLQYQKPSRLYIYDFDSATGDFTNKRFWESCGDTGFVGFNWHPKSDRLYVSSFNSVNAHGLKVFSDSGKRVVLEQEFVGDHESCWTKLHPTLKWLYVANFAANTISSFALDEEGVVTAPRGNVNRENVIPNGDTKEMWIDSAGKNFYVQGTGYSYTMAWYSISDCGVLTLNKEFKFEELIGAVNYTSLFVGIEGFEYCTPDIQAHQD